MSSCDDGDPVHEEGSGDGGEGHQPEPEENKDLLIDDVQGEHAQAILFLNSSGRTVLVEGALGHLREDGLHWVSPVLALHVGVLNNVHPVGAEGVTQKEVSEVDLTDGVDEVENLAEKEPEIIYQLIIN